MNDIFFYPRLTDELLENSGCKCDKYIFTYTYQDNDYGLKQKGGHTIKLTDPLEIWKVSTEGLNINKTITIAYPDFLFGPTGIAPKKAEIGICIIWTNAALTQTGYIFPDTDLTTATGRRCHFEYSFKPGMLTGNLELSVILYLKKRADTVDAGEELLMNEEGVSLGTVESVIIDFNSIYMEFPIVECTPSNKEPLWWVEFSEWEDPKSIDMFNNESFNLYLNPYYDACPKVGETIKNIDLLIDILSTTYLMIFKRLSDDDLKATKLNVGLAPNSICSILHQFIIDCDEELHWESDEKLLKSLQINLRNRLKEGDDR